MVKKKKKEIDWMNCKLTTNIAYDFEFIKRLYDPDKDIVKILNEKWKNKI